jgi:ABC-type multidrug transport system ATPase subunit
MMLFSGDDSQKQLGNLSGGEAARLIFARLGVEQPNVLVLDEPTNHLDLEAIEALVEGLRSYDGTLILVSHDRWFVSQLATRILEISPDGVDDYHGSYEEFVAHCGDDHLDAENAALKVRREKRRAKAERKKQGQPGHDGGKRRRKLEQRQAELEGEIERQEHRISEINELFCNPTFFDETPRKEVGKLEREQTELSASVADLTKEWDQVVEALGRIE